MSEWLNSRELFRKLREAEGQCMAPLRKPGEQIPCQEISDGTRLVPAPLVSVYVATYNHEPYVRQAIESILSQKCGFPYELVLAEDGSADRTREICLEYQRKHPELVRVLYSDGNVGVDRNFARTWSRLRGTYVACCEGDDYWICDTKLQEQVDFLETHADVDLVGGVCRGVVQADGESREGRLFPPIASVIRPTLLDYTFAHLSTWMHRRSLLDVFLQNGLVVPQTDSSMLTMVQGLGKCAILPRVYSVYRMTGHGMWSSLGEHEKRIERLKWVQSRLANYPAPMRPFFVYEIMVEYAWWFKHGVGHRHPRVALLAVGRLIRYAVRSPRSLWYYFHAWIRARKSRLRFGRIIRHSSGRRRRKEN